MIPIMNPIMIPIMDPIMILFRSLYEGRACSNKARNLVTKLSSVGVVCLGRYALCDVRAVCCALCFLFFVL